MAASYFKLKIIKAQNKSSRLKNRAGKVKSSTTNNSLPVNLKCRICLLEGTISIFSDLPKSTFISLNLHGGIEVDEKDNLPKHICSSCYTLLQSAILFRVKAQDADKVLRRTPNNIVILDNNKSDRNDGHHGADFQALESDTENIGNEKQYEHNCKMCNINFRNLNDFKTHNNNKHKNMRMQCLICNSILTINSFKKHLVRHESPTHLVCEVCGKLYRRDNLVRHLQLHSHDLPYHCKICPYRGRFFESLKIHVRTHLDRKPFACDNCHLRFLTKSNLNRHCSTHKDKPFRCTKCSRAFYTKRDLDSHITDHTGLKDFICNLCNNKYSSRKALMRHELRVHKRQKLAKGRTPLYLQPEYRKHLQEEREEERGEEKNKSLNYYCL